GVIVGPDGAFVGTVRARDLIAPIEASAARQRAAADTARNEPGGPDELVVTEPKAR
ncbi:MAG: hypothetical protein HOQ27_10285, partial [Dermatophilaceae bacterium]|nr:hypothetical protein [Dermatophilaceae bacterium]